MIEIENVEDNAKEINEEENCSAWHPGKVKRESSFNLCTHLSE